MIMYREEVMHPVTFGGGDYHILIIILRVLNNLSVIMALSIVNKKFWL